MMYRRDENVHISIIFREKNSLNHRLYSAKSNQNVFNAIRKCDDISCKRNDSLY